MPKLWYRKWTPKPDALWAVEKANEVLAEYAAQGFDLTLRQLYYQFVARGWIANKQSEYNRLGEIVSRARMAAMIDWNSIIDRTRNLRSLTHFNDPAHVIESAREFFHTNRWSDQDYHVEVWIEKDALVGVIEGVCRSNDVSFFSCRGYTSQSEMWGAAQRLLRRIEEGKKVLILHLGDHDPSGIDMSRDIEERTLLFLIVDYYRNHHDEGVSIANAQTTIEGAFQLDRLALNMDQVTLYDPPPNFAKITDSRAAAYIEEHGNSSWELDALEPAVMADLITDALAEVRDDDKYDAAVKREEKMRELLTQASERWSEVETLLNGKP